MDSSSLFAVEYQLSGARRYVVWISGEPDSVLLTSSGRLASFGSLKAVDAWLASAGLGRAPEAVFFNLDQLRAWCLAPSAESVECEGFYNGWNLLSDACHALGKSTALSAAALRVHEKLFWGCNVPGVIPARQSFHLAWSDEEVKVLAKELQNRLAVFGRGLEDAA